MESFERQGAYLCEKCRKEHDEYEETIAGKEGACELCGRYRFLLTFCKCFEKEPEDKSQLELF